MSRNPLGAVGFWMSLVGLFVLAGLVASYCFEARWVMRQSATTLILCGLLSPAGLLLSGAGVFRVPGTLATAGVTLGMLGTLILAGGGALLLADEMDMFTPPEELARRKEQRTIAALQDAADEIAEFVAANGNAPPEEEGQRLIRGYEDGWGKPLYYKPGEGKKFEVISAGPDEQFGNADDMTNHTIE